MANAHRSLLVCLVLGLASPALSDREVHVVAVGQGYRTEDPYALPEAHVLVDRPGQDVGLVLLDRGALHWRIAATDGTLISEIVLGGPKPETSEVSLTDVPVTGARLAGLPLVFRPVGRDFRHLLDMLADRFGSARISSFRGTHKAGAAQIRLDRVDTTTPGLSRDYLSRQMGRTDDLPPAIRSWLRTGGVESKFTVDLDEVGASLTGPSGTQRFPIAAHVPAILLPVGGVYDPGSQMIYCVTYGAEGYIYAIDVQTGEWSVVTDMTDYDAATLLFDAKTRQLITTGAFSRPGEIRVIGLNGTRSSVFVPTTAFPGLTDLFDYGNEHGPPLVPLVFSDGWLLAEARRDQVSGPHRLYAVQLATGEVRLLRFTNE